MSGTKPDERIRTPMRWDATAPAAGFSTGTPWEALSDDPASVNVADESADPGSLLSTYRDLIRLRASQPALASGELVPVDASDRHVVAFVRSEGPDAVLVVANIGNEAGRIAAPDPRRGTALRHAVAPRSCGATPRSRRRTITADAAASRTTRRSRPSGRARSS